MCRYPAQTPRHATETTLPITLQMNEMLVFSTTDVSCSDVIILDKFSWSGIRVYFNVCALEHLNALMASAGAGAAFIGFVSLLCPDCAPIATVITTIAAGFTANIDFLQYASQGCGGAFLDISWNGGIKFESACSTLVNGS